MPRLKIGRELLPLLRFLAGWVGRHLGLFLLWAAVVIGGFGAVMLGVVFVFTRGGSATCQTTAAAVAVATTLLFGAVAGGLLAATRTVSQWIRDTKLGPLASSAVFAQTLGVTDKRPEGKTDLAKSLQGAPLGEAKEKLGAALADAFNSGAIDRWLPAAGKWLTSRILHTAGSTAVWLAVRQLPEMPGDEAPLDLLALRGSVGTAVEEQAIGYVVGRVRWIAFGVLSLGATVGGGLIALVAWGFGQLGG